MGQSNWVFLEDCEILELRHAAVKIKYNGQIHWFPKSQVEDPDRLEEGDKGVTLGITEFIAHEKDIDVE